jgi:pentose-5-phosphate-3-epimerase
VCGAKAERAIYVSRASAWRRNQNAQIWIEVDGGVNEPVAVIVPEGVYLGSQLYTCQTKPM